LTHGLTLKNVFLRQQQFRRADDEAFVLLVARGIVASQRTLLQRNHVEPPSRTLELMKRAAQAAARAGSLESLLGIEGTAARLYFEQFAGMIKVDENEQPPVFGFQHRNRRPPRDPVNAPCRSPTACWRATPRSSARPSGSIRIWVSIISPVSDAPHWRWT
jgi:CRISPR-associated protein Cas1